jgi:mono/diheme cytochrome c family protein
MIPSMGGDRTRRLAIGMLATAWMAIGCSKDMQEQPSYHPQEAPRLHSPAGSVPRESRAIAPPFSALTQRHRERGVRLFAVNCTHCHGSKGDGDGPVAGYLKKLPANLHAARIQSKSVAELYEVVTHGKDAMPPFRGELSAEERWIVASFIKTFTTEGGANSMDAASALALPPRAGLPRHP